MATQGLSGKVCIVTGGGRGLGRAMVLGLARAGAKVVATAARTLKEVESVVHEAGEDLVLPLIADVTALEDCERVIKATLARFGRLHILVNNAGRGMRYISENFSSDMRSRLLDPKIIVPPLLWLASETSNGVTGRRIDASRWRDGSNISANIANSVDMAGWPG